MQSNRMDMEPSTSPTAGSWLNNAALRKRTLAGRISPSVSGQYHIASQGLKTGKRRRISGNRGPTSR